MNCSAIIPSGSRCGQCQSAWDARRPSSTERYGSGWAATSKRVIARDGGICRYCGGVATTADHVIARSQGGTHDDSNLVAACRPCNSRKRDR